MKEEKTYPIYSFSARWSEDGKWDPEYPKWHEGLPEGRIWSGTSFRKMYREEKTQDELDVIVKEWWEGYVEFQKKENTFKNYELESLKAEFIEYETWYLTWFQHETFDNGQTDEEALRSFEEYVTRTEDKNKKLQWESKEEYPTGMKSLMGAEDRWRWCGAGPNGERDENSKPPCRCKFCKEQGVLRIGH